MTPNQHCELWKKWLANLNSWTQSYRAIVIEKNVISDEKQTANSFNNFFINVGPKLANDIATATKSCQSYFQKTNETLKGEPITINELRDAFFPPKINKDAEYYFQCHQKLLQRTFWSTYMKIAKVTLVFKGGLQCRS